MKKIKIIGRYNSFSNAYNKGRIYFTSDDVNDICVDLYTLSTSTCVLHVNGHGPYHAEIIEYTIKSGLCSIVIEIQTSEDNIRELAAQQYSKSAILDIEYDEAKSLPRISNAFYNVLIKTMERMRKAMGLGSEMELMTVISSAYGYNVPINSNMYAADAKQLYAMLKQYAEENIREQIFDIADSSPDGFMKGRMAKGLCALCNKAMHVSHGGIPLCIEHDRQRGSVGDKKFKDMHHL